MKKTPRVIIVSSIGGYSFFISTPEQSLLLLFIQTSFANSKIRRILSGGGTMVESLDMSSNLNLRVLVKLRPEFFILYKQRLPVLSEKYQDPGRCLVHFRLNILEKNSISFSWHFSAIFWQFSLHCVFDIGSLLNPVNKVQFGPRGRKKNQGITRYGFKSQLGYSLLNCEKIPFFLPLELDLKNFFRNY